MEESFASIHPARPWNKGKLLGQKAPLKVSEVWAIRVRLQLTDRARDLALLDLAIDSKLRSCDLVALRVRDISHGDRVASRAVVMQRKTRRPVQFEITDPTRLAVASWVARALLRPDDYLFPSRCRRPGCTAPWASTDPASGSRRRPSSAGSFGPRRSPGSDPSCRG